MQKHNVRYAKCPGAWLMLGLHKGRLTICGRADGRQWQCNIIKYLLHPKRPELSPDLTAWSHLGLTSYCLLSQSTYSTFRTVWQPTLLALDFPWYQPYSSRQCTAVILNGHLFHASGPDNVCVSLVKSSEYRSWEKLPTICHKGWKQPVMNSGW